MATPQVTIETLQQRIAQLEGTLQEAQGTLVLERRLDNAYRKLVSVPKFSGSTSWAVFEQEFKCWYFANNINDLSDEFKKRALTLCMKEGAMHKMTGYLEGESGWNKFTTFDDYLTAVRGIFRPPEESEMALSEFEQRKQGRREDVSSYISSKVALWQIAYGEKNRSFQTLLNETIKGLANRIVKRNMRYATITNLEEMRRKAIQLVAAERQCYREGTSESTSLDGLSATTHLISGHDEVEDMEVDSVKTVAFQGNCHKCGQYGHRASTCKGTSKQKCYRCDRTGHVKRDCRARTKADGSKIMEDKKEGRKQKPAAKVQTQKEESDEDEVDNLFLEEATKKDEET